jgi:hypothetical protein
LPPPDALAFYIPYHHGYPHWWGIYVLVEGWISLARWIRRESNGRISWRDALKAAQAYLYGHEFYHHRVESFATRLEVTHRVPLYRDGFQRFFVSQIADSDEEALANGYAISVAGKVFPAGQTRDLVREVVERYVQLQPPGYRRGVRYAAPPLLREGELEFAENNHFTCLPSHGRRSPEI